MKYDGYKNTGFRKKSGVFNSYTNLGQIDACAWVVSLLFGKTFAGIFCPDVILLDFTAKALRIYMAGMVIFGIQIACQMTFVSIGNALCSIIVAVVRKFVLLLPLIYLVPRFVADKTMAVYLAEPIADVIAVTFTAFLFAVQLHKAIKKLQHSL